MPHTFVQKVETGERRLDVAEYVWYCNALGTTPLHGLEIVVDHGDHGTMRAGTLQERNRPGPHPHVAGP